jgi:hypothetical protein
MNISIPLLAQSFLRAQGLGSAESGYVLSYIEHFGLSRIRSAREKESPKCKTKPFQTHSKPFFQTPNPVFGRLSRILDKFRQNFLCKTKPFFSKIQIENKGLTAVSQSCEAALDLSAYLSRHSFTRRRKGSSLITKYLSRRNYKSGPYLSIL